MFVYYINVPLNERGILEFESYDKEMKNIYTCELTKEEYEHLRRPKGLFEQFDQFFGTIIDICEEERIELEDLPMAIKLTKKESLYSNSEIAKSAVKKVMESLNIAKESKTFWEIDIYLE